MLQELLTEGCMRLLKAILRGAAWAVIGVPLFVVVFIVLFIFGQRLI